MPPPPRDLTPTLLYSALKHESLPDTALYIFIGLFLLSFSLTPMQAVGGGSSVVILGHARDRACAP